MKIRSLVHLTLTSLLAVACVPEDETPRAYDEFVINETVFVSNGMKTSWDEGNFFWSPEDDGLFVNGVSYQLKDSSGCYYAKAASPTPNVNGRYYMAYYGFGSAHESLIFNENNGCVYETLFDPDSDWDDGNGGGVCNYVPLAACVTNNNVTLTPCCAVLRIKSASPGTLSIYNAVGETEGPFVMKGNIDPVTARFVNVENYLETSLISFSPIGGTNMSYVVLPMEHDQETIAGMSFSFGGAEDRGTTAPSITIRKGYVYDINLMVKN